MQMQTDHRFPAKKFEKCREQGRAVRTLRLIRKLTLPYHISFRWSSFLCVEISVRHQIPRLQLGLCSLFSHRCTLCRR